MFNPEQHLMRVKGGAQYLEVKWRLVWFREEHPDWGIDTKALVLDLDKGIAVFQAHLRDEQGNLISTGTKMETARDFGDFMEKAETGAIGRALAVAGYGTQFTGVELAEGQRIVDAPVGSGSGGRQQGERVTRTPAECPERGPYQPPETGLSCEGAEGCDHQLTKGQAEYSTKTYGRRLCPTCQRLHARGELVQQTNG
jgi:hypothetical protein